MGLRFIVLLAVVVLLPIIGADSATESNLPVLAGSQIDTAAKKKIFRIETAADEGNIDEERAFALPGVAQKITTFAKSSAQNVKSKVSQLRVETKFLKLQLKKKGSLSSPEMKKWAASVTKLYKNDPEKATKAMLTTLTNHFDELTVTRWAQAAKGSSTLGNISHNVQLAQFTKWLDAGQDALGVAKMLRSTATVSDNHRDRLIVQAFADFAKKSKSA